MDVKWKIHISILKMDDVDSMCMQSGCYVDVMWMKRIHSVEFSHCPVLFLTATHL